MAEHPNDPLIGQRFHDYRIEKKLAQGGMGAVYLLRHVELPDVLKVLKVIAPWALEGPSPNDGTDTRRMVEFRRSFIIERFEQEAAAISRLSHPNIVPIDGIGTVNGQRCMLMPYLVGTSLEDLIQERGGRLAPHEVLYIAAQIAKAMEYAHGRGIIHRDLKPSNVFVVPTEDDPLAIKVIDFGIAKLVNSDGSKTGAAQMGTPLYMAFEQFEDASSVTGLADVYALAIVVWKMVTGVFPWGVTDTAGLYLRRRAEMLDPPPRGTMPVGWEKTLRSACAVDLESRPQSMRELVHALALELPADPPRHESGIEILRSVARRWVESSPEDQAGRSAPAVTQDPPTINGRRRPRAVPPLQGVERQTPTPISSSSSAIVSPAAETLSAASSSTMPAAQGVTMLGASPGVAAPRATRGWKLAFLGVATALLAVLGVLIIISVSGISVSALRKPGIASLPVAASPSAVGGTSSTATSSRATLEASNAAAIPPAAARTSSTAANPPEAARTSSTAAGSAAATRTSSADRSSSAAARTSSTGAGSPRMSSMSASSPVSAGTSSTAAISPASRRGSAHTFDPNAAGGHPEE